MKYHTLFFLKIGKKNSQNLSSAAVVIGAFRVKTGSLWSKTTYGLLLQLLPVSFSQHTAAAVVVAVVDAAAAGGTSPGEWLGVALGRDGDLTAWDNHLAFLGSCEHWNCPVLAHI